MNYAILPLAVMGFIFGLSAYSEINKLKDRIKKLENEISMNYTNEGQLSVEEE